MWRWLLSFSFGDSCKKMCKNIPLLLIMKTIYNNNNNIQFVFSRLRVLVAGGRRAARFL